MKVVAHAHVPIEATGTVQGEAPMAAEQLGGSATQSPMAVEARSEFRLLSAAGIAFGVVALFIGLLLWLFKDARGLGDNMVTAGLLVLLANLLQRLHKWMLRSSVQLFRSLAEKVSKYE